MRWIPPRKSDVRNRDLYETYGIAVIQRMLADGSFIDMENGTRFKPDREPSDVTKWLKEKNDWTETKETWSFTMEIAITVFVAVEAVPIIYRAFCWVVARL
jgi:hypothetical protein